jgi:hypothetical protein
VYGHVLQQVRLLSEGLGAVLAAEGLLPGVGAEVHLDVGLVEEAPVADLAVVHHFLAQIAAAVSAAATAAETVAASGAGPSTAQQGSLEKNELNFKNNMSLKIFMWIQIGLVNLQKVYSTNNNRNAIFF